MPWSVYLKRNVGEEVLVFGFSTYAWNDAYHTTLAQNLSMKLQKDITHSTDNRHLYARRFTGQPSKSQKSQAAFDISLPHQQGIFTGGFPVTPFIAEPPLLELALEVADVVDGGIVVERVAFSIGLCSAQLCFPRRLPQSWSNRLCQT